MIHHDISHDGVLNVRQETRTGRPSFQRESPPHCPCRSRTYTLLIQSRESRRKYSGVRRNYGEVRAPYRTLTPLQDSTNPVATHDRTHDAVRRRVSSNISRRVPDQPSVRGPVFRDLVGGQS